MKYSRRLHGALILTAFALLFAVIGSAYCQSGTIGAEKPFFTARVDSVLTIRRPPYIITFTDSLGHGVLALHPNGDIFWRGRLVTTDSMLVQGLRDIIMGRR